MAAPLGAAEPDDAAAPEPAAELLDAEPLDAAPPDAAGAAAVLLEDEDEEELSVRPAPQAATDTARVRTPAAAISLRDVVLRMEPLSVGPMGGPAGGEGRGDVRAWGRTGPPCDFRTLPPTMYG